MSVSTETAGERPAVGALGLPWIITASSVGTLIEWYDFYLYGVLALFFSRHFFSPEPALDAWTAAKDRGRPTRSLAIRIIAGTQQWNLAR